MTLPVDLTVVVLSWNTRDLTISALRAIPAAAAPFRAKRVCVDNASADGSADAVRAAFPSLRADAVTVVENPRNLGYAGGNDAALPHVEGRAVAFLNSDALPSPGSLAAALSYLDARPSVGVVCPRLVGSDGKPQRTAWGFPTVSSLLNQYTPLGWLGVGRAATQRVRGHRGVADPTGPCDAVSGACLVIRRDLCERLGGFDAGYPFYFEDVDLCRRARDAGYEVHVAGEGPSVLHLGGASTALSDGATRLPLLQGALRFAGKTLSPLGFSVFAAAFASGVVFRSVWEVLRAPFHAALRRLRGRRERAARAFETAHERIRFLERDLLPFLRSAGSMARSGEGDR